MAVFRVEKSKDYTVMSNHHLRNPNLSLRAKGLLSQILSLPENWDYTIAGLAAINKEGKDAVRVAVQELEKAGYIERRQTMGDGGKFSGNEYVVYEEPVCASPLSDSPTTVKPSTEKPSTDSPLTENPTQLSKEVINNTPPNPPEGGAVGMAKKKGGRQCKSQAAVLPERFKKFWDFYRSHVPPGRNAGNRQKAIRAWDNLAPSDELVTEMARALASQVETQAWASGIGVPHASTWLNNRGWEDDWGAAPGSAPAADEDPNGEEAAEWAS